MTCPHCSSALPSDSIFCQFCGKKLRRERSRSHLVWLLTVVLLVLAGVFAGLWMRERTKPAEALPVQSVSDEQFQDFCTLAREESLGYGNEYFRVDRSVFVLPADGEARKLKLTASWKDVGNVYVECSSDAAELRFTEDEWERYTTMTVTPRHPGVTIARFRSDATDATFAVWIYVEDAA